MKSSPPSLNLLLRAYRFLLPYWRYVLGTYASEALIIAFNLAIPQFIGWIVDKGMVGGNTSLLLGSTLALLGMTTLKGVGVYLQGIWSEIGSQSVAYDLRNAIQTKLTLLSFSFHDQSESGQLLSRAVQDVDRIRFLTGRATLRIVDGAVLAVATAVILALMNWRLALMVSLAIPLLVNRAMHMGWQLRPLSVKIQDQLGILTTRLEQNLRGSRVVKAFAQEPAEIARFEKENTRWFTLSNRSARVQSVNAPLLDLIANMGTVVIIYFGGRMVMDGSLTLGELVAFTTYLGQLFGPVRQLGQIIPAIAMAISSAGRIFEILDAVADVHDKPGAKPLPPVEGHVRFENVSFAYGLSNGGNGNGAGDTAGASESGDQEDGVQEGGAKTGRDVTSALMAEKEAAAPGTAAGAPAKTQAKGKKQRVVLDSVSLEARPGQVTALLGATGSGKSTITNLIPRFYDPTGGRILIDGYDIRGVTLQSLRSQVGMVLQESTLFIGTIHENIAFGRSGATRAEVIEAARAAQAHDFITSMPEGYETMVGERGVTLSGGQKQRIALARALLTDPRILILDDATASVDTETERLIQSALDRLMEGRTTFVIAHRLSTVRRADQILVLENGRIVERGNHAELLEKSMIYRDVYERQLKRED